MRAHGIHTTGANDAFDARLRSARAHARLTEDEAAGLAGLTVKKLQAMERGGEAGRQPNTQAIAHLAAAYGVSAVWLAAGGSAGAKLTPAWYRAGETAAVQP